MRGSPRAWLDYGPPTLAAVLLVALTVSVRHVIQSHTGGVFTYPLDDAYIHLAMARSIADHGVYGVTPDAFSATSSSIVWPHLIAFFMKIVKSAGARTELPLWLNVASGIGLLFAADFAIKRVIGEARARFQALFFRALWLVLVVVCTPLVTLVSTGMEHTLHAALTVAILGFVMTIPTPTARAFRILVALVIAAALVRYEALALLPCLLLRYRKEGLRRLGALSAAAVAPPLLFGLYLKAHGALLLPNSVVLKGRHLHIKTAGDVFDFFIHDFAERAAAEPHLPVVLALLSLSVLALFSRSDEQGRAVRFGSIASLFVFWAHVQFASFGWFYRYEGYLMALAMVQIAATAAALVRWETDPESPLPIKQRIVRNFAFVLGTALALVVPLRRGFQATNIIPLGSTNIYEQQVQSARFVEKHFAGQTVALNDIGAVAYFSTSPIVDLVGLASFDVAKAKKFDILVPLETEDVRKLTSKAKLAIVYDGWFKDNLPEEWLRVARWTIEFNAVCAEPSVSVYITDKLALPNVLAALRSFAPSLPPSVHQEGLYLETEPASGIRSGDHLRLTFSNAERSSYVDVQADGFVAGAASAAGAFKARGLTAPELTRKLMSQKVTQVDHVIDRRIRVFVSGTGRTRGMLRPNEATVRSLLAEMGAPDDTLARLRRLRLDKGAYVEAPLDGMSDVLFDGDVVFVEKAR